jgi:NAD(P)-dependent dehydrogenase (short-subunit alcohol dehydrogenase family)
LVFEKIDMAWSLVCPANRGIGFHLARHLLQITEIPVVATTRQDVSGVRKSILRDLKDVDDSRLTVLEVDVTSNFPLFVQPMHALQILFVDCKI